MFRCQIDPMIGPKPRNAFVPDDLDMTAVINEEGTGIIVNFKGQEHFIFGANIQSVRLKSEPQIAERKQLGRPKKHEAEAI